MDQTFLNMDEAAEFLRIRKGQLYKFTSRKKIAFSKLGRAIVFAKADLIDFVERMKIPDDNTIAQQASLQAYINKFPKINAK